MYIKREDAINAIHAYFKEQMGALPIMTDEDGDEYFANTKEVDEKCLKPNKKICGLIKAIPSADVVEREDYEQMRFLVDSLVENLGDRRWIPCSERLPQKEGAYLVSCYGKTYLDTLLGIEEYEDEEEGVYAIICDWDKSSCVPKEDMAWMMLPEPWRGADDE